MPVARSDHMFALSHLMLQLFHEQMGTIGRATADNPKKRKTTQANEEGESRAQKRNRYPA